jgi:WD40 repeat protein/mono/diheme cytochrome c family protein
MKHPHLLQALRFAAVLLLLAPAQNVSGADGTPVSFHRDVFPILRANCVACHKPGKAKGQLDLSTFPALMKGGKAGEAIHAGKPETSELIETVSGDEPEMPKDGEPLTPEEVAVITRWIAEGAKDDTPADGGLHRLAAPPVYRALPSVSALAWSPDGSVLAVSGFHEVLLHSGDGSKVIGRLVGQSPRIESVAFSPDGRQLAVAGGAASEYGEIQLWDLASQQLVRSILTTKDSVFGVSFSPDASRVAVGCADKTVRVFATADGREVMKCDNHIDWVYATCFSDDGQRLVSASRDRAVKLIDVATGRLIDDVNIPRDPVLSLARHPRENLVVFGDEKGGIRIHKMEPRGGRLAEGDNKENSYVRECERMPGPVHALAWSADGQWIAAGCATGETRLFKAADGKRVAMLKGAEGAVFAVAFEPTGASVVVGGYDGKLRVFETASGKLTREFDPVPLAPITAAK